MYVDKDPINRHIALAVLHRLHEQHPRSYPYLHFQHSTVASRRCGAVHQHISGQLGVKVWASGFDGGILGVPERQPGWKTSRSS